MVLPLKYWALTGIAVNAAPASTARPVAKILDCFMVVSLSD
jgi:hypothetical protein